MADDLVTRLQGAPRKFDPLKGWVREVSDGGVTIYEPVDPPGKGETGKTPRSTGISPVLGLPLGIANMALGAVKAVTSRLGTRTK